MQRRFITLTATFTVCWRRRLRGGTPTRFLKTTLRTVMGGNIFINLNLLLFHAPPQRGPADTQNLARLALVALHRCQHLAHALLFGAAAGVFQGHG